MMLRDRQVLLVSASPRREELLRLAGLNVFVRPSHAKEDAQAQDPAHQAMAIARQKLAALDAPFDPPLPQHLMALPRIAADTMVVLDGMVLGKPQGADDARAMLCALAGKSHEVITGVVVAHKHTQQAFAVRTRVHFRPLTNGDVDAYIATGEPFDKAGAYGIQGKGSHLIDRIEGSLTNVIGLPLKETLEALEAITTNV